MNQRERALIRYVCDGDMRNARLEARIILNGINTKKDEQFKENMLRKLDCNGDLINLPNNLKGILVAEDMRNFPEERFILRTGEAKIVRKTIDIYRAAERLSEIGISYLPALILHGQSGCGKTMLARYIAHKANLPFVYVNFSNLVESLLGKTQSNISRVFEYVRENPCVLCFDEIDAIGMARGQNDDVGEMNRIVISMMQEMDRIRNDVIIIGTTNRFDRLDPALVRRFPIRYELKPLAEAEVKQLAQKLFSYAGVDSSDWIDDWCSITFDDDAPASTVVKECTDVILNQIIEQMEGGMP